MKNKVIKKGLSNALAFILTALPLANFFVITTRAQTPVKAAKSCATPQQDVELGHQAAAEAEKQFQLVNDSRAQEYINRLGQNLALNAPGEKFQYSFKLLNVGEINAFALPGGFTYVNRGTIEAAKNEAELAGVMAHEISHVALRHGTANVCKAQSYQGIAGIVGAVLGNGVAGAIGGAAASVVAGGALMKNSRAAESDADILGSQIMAKAGYDPNAMADFFETLRGEQTREPGKLERWFSDHPQPADREARIRAEAKSIGSRGNGRELGGFAEVKRMLQGMPKAPSAQQQAQQQGGQRQPTAQNGQPVNVRVDAPSSNLKVFRQQSGAYEITYPDNWQASSGNSGIASLIFPNGGVMQDGSTIYGVIIDTHQSQQSIDPRTRRPRPASLDTSTKELIESTLQGNNYLRVVSGPSRYSKVGGRAAMTATLEGRSPITNRDERAMLFNMQMKNGDSLHIIFVTPKDDFSNYQNLFRRMLQSMRINN